MRLEPLTIAAGQSRIVSNEEIAKLENLCIYSVAANALANVLVSHKRADESPVLADFVPLLSLGVAITIPAGAGATTLTEKGFESLILTGTNTDVFQVTGQEQENKGF